MKRASFNGDNNVARQLAKSEVSCCGGNDGEVELGGVEERRGGFVRLETSPRRTVAWSCGKNGKGERRALLLLLLSKTKEWSEEWSGGEERLGSVRAS